MTTWLHVCLTVFLLGSPVIAGAQTPGDDFPAETPAAGLLLVFLDCGPCDSIYQRETVTFVEYVRDRTLAEVHVLATTENTGGGGQRWTVQFIGRGRFAGQDQTLTFSTPQTATSDDRRRAFARVFRLGLVPYVMETPVATELDVVRTETDDGEQASPEDDPWSFWVFRVGGNANVDGQQTRESWNFNVNMSASRTTELWKISISGNRSSNRTTFDVDDGDPIVSRRHSWNVNGLLVRSVGGRFSVGTRLRASHSSFSNTQLSITTASGPEFDFFPYSESSRRSLTVTYSVGASQLDYVEETIYEKLTEIVPHHALNVSLGLRQPWGSLGAVANVSQHLNDRERRRLSVSTNADVRLFRGFSLDFFGSYQKIADQIALRKGDATTEEILLNLQQLRTDHSFDAFIGLSYSFGSIFNSVVNPRFSNAGSLSF
jgi:hypothetical protein